MGRVLLIIVATLATVAALTTATIAFGLWRLRRRKRVTAGTMTVAPAWWRVRPGRCARLHRRLRAATAAANYSPAGRARRSLPLAEVERLADDLTWQAVALDHQLVLASRARPGVRRGILDTVEVHVEHVEALAGRLAWNVAAADGPVRTSPETDLEAIADRLDAIETARAEIAALESAAGLYGPEDDALRPEPPTERRKAG
jgi:hypothetical protein